MTFRLGKLTVLAACLPATMSLAQNVDIRPGQASVSLTINDRTLVIGRNPDQSAVLTGDFARTSRPCPDFCIQPMIVADGVAPVAELEVIDFLSGPVSAGTGLLIDARLPEWFIKGTLPAAVNVPFAALAPDNPYQTEILKALGATGSADSLDFSNARTLVIYGNGPWDEQGTRAVRHLIDAGYPASKLRNYRGGVQAWAHLGLTLTNPAP